jgi:hypothetical protein
MADDETPPPDVQNVGIQMGEGTAVGGDVTGGDKITAGGHVIQAAAGATIIIGGAVPGQVGEGLSALTDLVQRSPEVRQAVIGFRTDFQAASEQIDLLVDFKDLHDILHRLQFQCFNTVQQIAPRFPDDELAIDTLTDSQLTLEGLIDEVKKFGTRTSDARNETSWMQDMVDARAELQTAIDTSDPKVLKKTIGRLNRLLSIIPAKINGRLNNAARALRLPSLTQALSGMLGSIQTLELEADKKQQFETGVTGLVTLSQVLTTLIESHDRWQDVDVELRHIETIIEYDLFVLEDSWPGLKSKTTALCKDVVEEWAAAIQKEADGLEQMLAAQNPAKVKRSFRMFRRRASERFFRVDIDLKTVCGELRLVGQPLAAVLRIIE